ncbi:MAG: protein translocase subunit SecD [Planctomycetes bacterium]|nr:protein translocase subunit SecD [Planctomycetota bacterium]
MSRNLVPKFILILVLVVLAVLALYPPSRTLKPGIDLAGGTSLIYAINTEGLTADQETGLAQKMIQVLRRRIDPANIQNLVWRPLGNTRFEIQMPLASKETQDKRDEYLAAMDKLLAKNINPATIMRALRLPPEQRKAELEGFAQNDPNHLAMLNTLASTYDERQQLQQQRDTLTKETQALAEKMKTAGLDVSRIDANRRDWAKLNDEALVKAVNDFLGDKQKEPQNPASVQAYVRTQAKLAGAINKLTAPGGVNEKYEDARKQLDQFSITRERIMFVAELPAKTAQRAEQLAKLESQYPDRVPEIDRVVAAYDAYRPFQGRLDDPADLRRMLKGAGILEFRILPTTDRPELSAAEIQRYLEALASKGPKAASDNQYIWVEIENYQEWKNPTTIVGQFGDKYYVLASNRLPDEAMLHGAGMREWKLDSSHPTSDDIGRRAIGFNLDLRGGDLFYNVTSKNQNRPLAIILDDKAISAPNINSPIRDKGIIQGTFTPTQVTDMVDKLNAGSLPARMIDQPISERVIGPSIGADNVHRGIVSGLIGMFLVIGFMLVYYTIGGSIADVAMLMNLLFTLAIMALLRATFTLSGIASTILTIGMSVDANVLIFERIREEQEKGVGLATAIRNGYQRAFSAIFDSNLTTVLAAAILYYVGTEDLKGFAIVLILGLISNLFTAVFVTRVILEYLVSKRILKNRLVMMRLIRVPHIDWMRLRPIFFTLSGVAIIGGLTIFFLRDKSKYGIEFTGGTSVQIALKQGASLTRQDAQDRMSQIGDKLKNPDLSSAGVYSVGDPVGQTPRGDKIYDQYEITTMATNKLQTTLTLAAGDSNTADTVAAAVRKTQSEMRQNLGDFTVTPGGPGAFVVTNTYVNPPLVHSVLTKAFPQAQISEPKLEDVVSDAIRQAFEGQLALQQNLKPTITSVEKVAEQTIETYPELAQYAGGLKIEVALETPASLREIDQRIKDLEFRPDTQELTSYTYGVFAPGLKPAEATQPLKAFTFVSMEPEAGLRELNETEWVQFVDNEKTRILQATERETSLPRVTRIDPFVSSEAKTRALVAGVLAVLAMGAYVWFRWGDARYGFGAIVTLVHDAAVAIGLISICTYLAATTIGQALLIGDFKIDLVIIAAILTLIGYSINDTVVIYDRIRENRTRRGGRELLISSEIINDGINQTFSRTIITGFTTLMVLAVLYVFGGEGLRGFTFLMLTGIIEGTYSSVAISAPVLLLWRRYEQTSAARQAAKQAQTKMA